MASHCAPLGLGGIEDLARPINIAPLWGEAPHVEGSLAAVPENACKVQRRLAHSKTLPRGPGRSKIAPALSRQ